MGGLAASAGACHVGPNLPTPIYCRELGCQANRDGAAGRKWRLSPCMLLPAGAALGPSAHRCTKAWAFCPLMRAESLAQGCSVQPGALLSRSPPT